MYQYNQTHSYDEVVKWDNIPILDALCLFDNMNRAAFLGLSADQKGAHPHDHDGRIDHVVSQGSGLPSFCAGGIYARKLPRWLHQEQILNTGARLHFNLSFKSISLLFLLVLSSFKQIDFKTGLWKEGSVWRHNPVCQYCSSSWRPTCYYPVHVCMLDVDCNLLWLTRHISRLEVLQQPILPAAKKRKSKWPVVVLRHQRRYQSSMHKTRKSHHSDYAWLVLYMMLLMRAAILWTKNICSVLLDWCISSQV